MSRISLGARPWFRRIALVAAMLTASFRAHAQTADTTDARPAGRLTSDDLARRPLVSAPAPGALGTLAQNAQTGEPGSELSVLLLTIGPGSEVWQRFGHNAIWIRDRARGLDIAFNWGTFDFNQPNFLTRFLTGNTQYWLVGLDGPADVARYMDENRSVWVQELDLTPAQRLALLQYVTWNAQDAHKYYRYDYYLDNCSTRVRDALDRVTGGALRRVMTTQRTGTSYRSHTRRLTADDPFVYTGIQLALGRPADAELTAWEESFLPVELMRHVRDVRIPGANGASVPLVRSERALFLAHRAPELTAAPSYLWRYLVGGLALAGVLLVLARGAARGRRGSAATFGVLAGVWLVLVGLLGTALLLAGTVTRHVFMGRNLNLAAYSPLALLLLVVLVIALGARRRATRARWTQRASMLALLSFAITVIGWLGILVAGQRSGEMFALALPVHAALWLGLSTIARGAERWS